MSSFGKMIPPLLVAFGLWGLVGWAARKPIPARPDEFSHAVPAADATVDRVNRFFQQRWAAAGVNPADPADELQVLRRIALVLQGTVPSLEEIRQFEADTVPQRLERWTKHWLEETRYANYFAERLARTFVGVADGPPFAFRRDRFIFWLSDQLAKNRPYDDIARDLIQQRGLFTGNPPTNFVTVAVNENLVDENKLAGRTVRAFLGQRIDCAQCHNHPFAVWKQHQFQELAAFYGQTKFNFVTGVEDDSKQHYEVENRMTLKKEEIAPAVPFHPEWLPAEGTLRGKLAGWTTHAENRRFDRAIVNRVWGLLFGRPYHEPVDDLPDPPEQSTAAPPDLLDILADDFRAQGRDLRRLIRVITQTEVFRLSSQHPAFAEEQASAVVEANWAVYPLTRLRPEQFIGAMLQATALHTIDHQSNVLTRAIRFFRENDFVKAYGDLGEDELTDQSGTIPQALLRMNGSFSREILQTDNPFLAPRQLADLSPNDELTVRTAYLVTLARNPTPAEATHFLERLHGHKQQRRQEIVEDLFWSLVNSPEFSWNH